MACRVWCVELQCVAVKTCSLKSLDMRGFLEGLLSPVSVGLAAAVSATDPAEENVFMSV